MIQIPVHSRFETAFESACVYPNPVQDVRVTVEFSKEAGGFQVDAFWDGDQQWRVRFAPPNTGRWLWRTHCSNPADKGLHAQHGQFECIAGPSSSDWLNNGPLQVSADGRHLEYANQTPFFWLADTAWNGPLKALEGDWDRYLADRGEKGFSVIQFVATQWLGGATDEDGRTAYTDPARIRIDPMFFHRLDRRIDRINELGLVAAPVLAWAATWNKDGISLNPGSSLSDDQLIVLVRYLVSRFGAHQVVWILAGDGDYLGAEAERWRQIGRATLAGSPRLATMHPAARIWVNKEFEGESWYSFIGYQSGQWKGPESSRWINERVLADPRTQARFARAMPMIDLEPCYEDHIPLDVPSRGRIDDCAVRRACYWSLLAAPVAGVSYGAQGVWSWEESPAVPLHHPKSGTAQPWQDAIGLPGSVSLSHLQAIFKSIDWWRLNPCQEMLAAQPGIDSPLEFVAAACSTDKSIAAIYAPAGGAIWLRQDFFGEGAEATFLDPATGAELWAGRLREHFLDLECRMDSDRLVIISASGEDQG